MNTCVCIVLSRSYCTVCWVLLSVVVSTTLAVYQQSWVAGSGSVHHTAILSPLRSAWAFCGAVVVFPCSIRRSKFQAACVGSHV